jgi:hypothetical protein
MPGIMSRLAPKVISPKTHAIIDYVHAGTNIVAGVLFRRSGRRRASNAAYALGAGVLVNALMTDYPLGMFRRYSFRVHGALDYGIAAASAAMPRLLGIEDQPEARYFSWQGSSEGVIAAMSDYTDETGARWHHGRLFEWRRAA